ncbi:MAG TPA: hypothetical protein VMY18_08645 [Acidobacteriota bacterium]|nr:hypothetical protein [Acidobacteriota bacterium]
MKAGQADHGGPSEAAKSSSTVIKSISNSLERNLLFLWVELMSERIIDTLICGEDPVSLRFLEAMLEAEGFKVEAYSHVSRAVLPCLRRRYRMAIISLEHFEWAESEEKLEILRIIRGIDPLMPLVVICEQESLEVERRLREEGIFYFLTRPVSVRELREVVQCAIMKRVKTTEA